MRLFEVENWRVGAIARQLRVRHEPVRQVLKQADVGPAPIAPRANHVSANVDSRRSLLVSLWFEGVEGNVLLGPDQPALPVAAVDRLVHHSTILEMNVDSYRRRAALPARRQRSPNTMINSQPRRSGMVCKIRPLPLLHEADRQATI